jgi:hypothetical protein
MASNPHLLDTLPVMPTTGKPVVAAIDSLIALLMPVYHLQDSLSEGCWTIARLKANTQSPSESNGGILTFDPSTGQVRTAYQVGYGLTPSIPEIYKALQDTSRRLQIWIDFTGTDTAWVTVSLYNVPKSGDSSSISVGIPDTCCANSDLRSAKYTYTGYGSCTNLIGLWQDTPAKGWFAPWVVAEAWSIGTQDMTGYKFAGDPPAACMHVTPDHGGCASWLNGLLICAQMESDLVFDAGEDSSVSHSTVVLHSESARSQQGVSIPIYENSAVVIGGWIGSFSNAKKGAAK